jgi:hypothetical protein
MRKNLLLAVCVGLAGCSGTPTHDTHTGATATDTVQYADERHFASVRQLTWGGDNAEAYWSSDSRKVVFQATNEKWNAPCDQIYFAWVDSTDMRHAAPPMLSTGLGRTTCSYFMPGDSTIIYASTHGAGPLCPPKPEKRADGKYVWAIYDSFDIYTADMQGQILKRLTDSPGYDAEPTVSPKGDRVVFTSLRSGDLELYTMNLDGSDVRQITHELGYDGGAFFSPDGSQIIFRASRPTTDEDIRIYKELLAEGLVMPTRMELFVCNADGTGLRQLTQLGGANWAPFFHPSGQKVIFSSNHASERGFPFNLYMINVDGTGLERITHDGVFDAFPMFSPDGRRLIFSSNRNNKGTRDTNLFVAEWKD